MATTGWLTHGAESGHVFGVLVDVHVEAYSELFLRFSGAHLESARPRPGMLNCISAVVLIVAACGSLVCGYGAVECATKLAFQRVEWR